MRHCPNKEHIGLQEVLNKDFPWLVEMLQDFAQLTSILLPILSTLDLAISFPFCSSHDFVMMINVTVIID